MPGLASERCLHHETREAVCRCPNCLRFFCRECVVPFDGRLLCATCITKANETPSAPEKRTSYAPQIMLGVGAMFFIWLAFYFLGWIVLQYRETLPIDTAEQGNLQSTTSARAAGTKQAPGRYRIRLLTRAVQCWSFHADSGHPLPHGHGSVKVQIVARNPLVALWD